jgi:hypothetical protein
MVIREITVLGGLDFPNLIKIKERERKIVNGNIYHANGLTSGRYNLAGWSLLLMC